MARGEVVDLGGVRQRRILAALLLAPGHEVDVDRLHAVAWGSAPTVSARRLVQNRVADLRAVLTPAGGILDTTDTGYRLRVAPDQLDLAVFDRLVEDGRAAADPML